MHKDYFGKVIEPGDTILRCLQGRFEKAVVVKISRNYIYIERPEYSKRWVKNPDKPIGINLRWVEAGDKIINLTKLNYTP